MLLSDEMFTLSEVSFVFACSDKISDVCFIACEHILYKYNDS